MQSHSYWCLRSFQAVTSEHEAAVKAAEALLPEEFCIIATSEIAFDNLADLKARATIAESAYHKLAEELAVYKERYNIND